MPFDYSSLFTSEDGYTDTWREIYDSSLALPHNLLYILRHIIFLPYDFYDLIAVYYLLPSALCQVIPYLFLYGQSGSGKSSLAELARHLHGVKINGSNDTFAGIRNDLNARRRGVVEIPNDSEVFPVLHKEVEKNTFMVWEDISNKTFSSNPEIYNMFKFGYNRSTDRITISSDKIGENMEFRCFCPKVFSSISPLHLNDMFRELRRRLIVIPCQKLEEIHPDRKAELNISNDNWHSKYLDVFAYDWEGFPKLFDEYWNIENAGKFVQAKKSAQANTKGLTSQQRAISIDLIACGIATGIWTSLDHALERVKTYWDWFKLETEKSASLGSLLKTYLRQEQRNATEGGRELEIYTSQLRAQIDTWVQMGWLLEKPRPKDIQEQMLDLGMRLQHGKWRRN